MARLLIGLSLTSGALLFGCSEEASRPAPLSSDYGQGAVVPACQQPKQPDTTESCADESVQLFARQPTIYFILDTSGSMEDHVLQGGDTKLDAAKSALTEVVKEIGHRSKYGLAAFPGENLDDSAAAPGCAAGEEVFGVKAGDPIECVNLPPNGPVFRSFVNRLKGLEASGGTPLSPTLEKLAPDLLGREDSTAVVLITDGAPNCNGELFCAADDCSLNIQGQVGFDDSGHEVVCDENFNCCDPELTGQDLANRACVDGDASVKQLEDLREAGIPTYVIGVLGAEDFDSVMNRLALAGGRPREGERSYYDVESVAELTETVRKIGLDLTQTCTIELSDRPLYANELNVYFDGELVPAGEGNGWTLEGDTVSIVGDACDRLESGEITEVQLLTGCQTIVR